MGRIRCMAAPVFLLAALACLSIPLESRADTPDADPAERPCPQLGIRVGHMFGLYANSSLVSDLFTMYPGFGYWILLEILAHRNVIFGIEQGSLACLYMDDESNDSCAEFDAGVTVGARMTPRTYLSVLLRADFGYAYMMDCAPFYPPVNYNGDGFYTFPKLFLEFFHPCGILWYMGAGVHMSWHEFGRHGWKGTFRVYFMSGFGWNIPLP
jgi:hypothetical protein